MNPEIVRWSRRYQTALHKHLKQHDELNARMVQTLGRQAVALGLEILDLAKAHEQALSSLLLQPGLVRTREKLIERARSFFDEVAIRIEQTHSAALEADAHIHQLRRTLKQRTLESSASRHLLKQTILQRLEAEKALKTSAVYQVRLLAESNRLMKHLRHLAHLRLSTQEGDRRSIGRQLHDEIAQSLLGVHVRLLTLNKTMKASAMSLKKEIGSTQRLVTESNRKVKLFTHEWCIEDND